MAKRSAKRRRVNLALQGGGAHGAYAWGVLDSFLESGAFEIEGISGASAGSVNAVVYAYGNMVGGVDGARELLAAFWKRLAGTRPGFGGPHAFQTLNTMTGAGCPSQANPGTR